MPTVNLTNGTFVSRPIPELKVIATKTPVAASWVAAASPVDPAVEAPPVVATLAPVRFDLVLFRVPPPPMGRTIITTFPSVYKEFGSKAPRPGEGRVWPRTVTE